VEEVHRDPIIGTLIVIVNDLSADIKTGFHSAAFRQKKEIKPTRNHKNCIIFRFWIVTDSLNPFASRFVGTNLAIKMGDKRR
jgi:hypothetical protein